MERWEIRPGEGIGPVRLGMTGDEVRAAMGEEGKPHAGGEDSLWFAAMTMRVDFDDDGHVEFVEIPHDAHARLGDLDVFSLERRELVARLAERFGEEAPELDENDAYRFMARGLSLWGVEQQTDRGVEAIGVFGPGYYDG